jgi:two-component system chemotaxis response regulator CheB
VDVLFRSVAKAYGSKTIAVVLTGMGQDGMRGAENIRAAGGQILVQDEASSVVWGMPGAVANAGLAEKILPLKELAAEVVSRVSNSPKIPADTPRVAPGASLPKSNPPKQGPAALNPTTPA